MFLCPVCFDNGDDGLVPVEDGYQWIDGEQVALDAKDSFILHLLHHLAEIQTGELVLTRL